MVTGTVFISAVASEPEVAPKPRPSRFRGQVANPACERGEHFNGRVIAVSANSLTVVGVNQEYRVSTTGGPTYRVTSSPDGLEIVHTGPGLRVRHIYGEFEPVRTEWVRAAPDGLWYKTADGEVRLLHPNGPVTHTFKASPILAAGDFPEDASNAFTYRLTDVRVGDKVTAIYHPAPAGGLVCTAVSIARRPGGKVPRPPGHRDNYGVSPYWDELMNAAQEREEKEQKEKERATKGQPKT